MPGPRPSCALTNLISPGSSAMRILPPPLSTLRSSSRPHNSAVATGSSLCSSTPTSALTVSSRRCDFHCGPAGTHEHSRSRQSASGSTWSIDSRKPPTSAGWKCV